MNAKIRPVPQEHSDESPCVLRPPRPRGYESLVADSPKAEVMKHANDFCWSLELLNSDLVFHPGGSRRSMMVNACVMLVFSNVFKFECKAADN